jgi:hypothetical protein
MFGLFDLGSIVGLYWQGRIVEGMDVIVGRRGIDRKTSRKVGTRGAGKWGFHARWKLDLVVLEAGD